MNDDGPSIVINSSIYFNLQNISPSYALFYFSINNLKYNYVECCLIRLNVNFIYQLFICFNYAHRDIFVSHILSLFLPL